MTSPTQLKYLNAIGVPVWVSRDIVIADVAASDESAANLSVAKSIGDDAVESILEGLNQSDKKALSILLNTISPILESANLKPDEIKKLLLSK